MSKAKNGARVTVAGVVLVRQRPGNGKAIFITLEDETGIANVLLWARVFEAQADASDGVAADDGRGRSAAQRAERGGVVHLMGARVVDRTHELARLSEDRETRPAMARADIGLVPDPRYTKATSTGGRHPRDVRILPKSRDFH